MRFVEKHSVMQERGKVSELARALNITPGAISQWEQVPADKVMKVADFIGVPAERLRPDMFPAPAPQPEAAR